MSTQAITEGSSYKKIPVMTASGRTVNDSSVIVKQILVACGGGEFDAAMQEEITFGLQPAIEVDVLGNGADFKKLGLKIGFPLWCVPEFLLASMMGSKIAEKIKRSYPDMKPAVDYGKSFKSRPGSTASSTSVPRRRRARPGRYQLLWHRRSLGIFACMAGLMLHDDGVRR